MGCKLRTYEAHGPEQKCIFIFENVNQSAMRGVLFENYLCIRQGRSLIAFFG